MQQLSIGAVAKLTQIPAHTLRKWESRHGIAVPLRSDTGRRVYTEAHVEVLRLIKTLVNSGHALAHLAELDLDALRDLAGMHDAGLERTRAGRIGLIGPNVARLLAGHRQVRFRSTDPLPESLAAALPTDEAMAYVVESVTLPDALIDALISARPGMAGLFVVYRYTPSETLTRLRDADIVPIQGPVDEEQLLRYLEPLPLEEERPVRRQRFSDEELARIAALNPGLQCECPNHIAKLLMDITAFEKYSNECVDTDPAEKALHQRLASISAEARGLLEDALVAVASADGIALSLRE